MASSDYDPADLSQYKPGQVGIGPDSCFCWEGYEGNKASRTCEPCRKGYYKDKKLRLDISNSSDGNWQWSDIVEALNADNFGQQCIQCPQGKYGTEIASERCTDCVAGKFMGYGSELYTLIHPPDKDECEPCYYNLKLESEGARYCPPGSPIPDGVLCAEGHFCPDFATQTPCPNGYYSLGGQKACTECPENSWHYATGQTKSSCQCNAGYTGPDGGPCFPCLEFSSKVVSGNSSCLCDAGYLYDDHATAVHSKPGQSVCEKCNEAVQLDNYYKPNIGNAYCSECPPNSIATADSTDCQCNDNFGSLLLIDEPRTKTDKLVCSDCQSVARNFFKVPDQFEVECEEFDKCALLNYQLTTSRRERCIDCNYGSYSVQLQQLLRHGTLSVDTNGVLHVDNHNQVNWEKFNKMYSSVDHTCRCDRGHEIDSTTIINSEPGSHKCKICSNGKYKANISDDEICQECPVGKTSFNTETTYYKNKVLTTGVKVDGCVCDKGYECADPNDPDCDECTLCPVAKFKDTLGDQRCQQCESGKTADASVSTTSADECVFCELGKFYDASSAAICELCPVGKKGTFFLKDTEYSICTDCDTDTISVTPGSTECTACENGKKSVYGGTACFDSFCGTGSDREEYGVCLCKQGYRSAYQGLVEWTPQNQYDPQFFTADPIQNRSQFQIRLYSNLATCIDRVSGGHAKDVYYTQNYEPKTIQFFVGDYVKLMVQDEHALRDPTGWILMMRKVLSQQTQKFYLDDRLTYENFTIPQSFMQEFEPGVWELALMQSPPPTTIKWIQVAFSKRPDKFDGCFANIQCDHGQVFNEMSKNSPSCKACETGKYADAATGTCLKCPSFQTTAGPGSADASACLCDYGRHGSNCTACDIGFSKAVLGPNACLPCVPGTYQNAMGSRECIPCPRGFSSTEYGSHSCFPCGPYAENCSNPFFSNETMDTDNLRYYMRLKSAAECQGDVCSAQPGFFCNMGLCVNVTVECIAGHFCPGGNVTMQPCDATPGSFCPAGLASESYSECPVNFYCPGGSSDKIACPLFTESAQHATQKSDCLCKPGYTYNSERESCEPCFEGSFKTSYGPQPCTTCPLLKISNIAAVSATDCVCIPGYFTQPNASCSACPPDTFSSARNSSSCQDAACEENHTSPDYGATTRFCVCSPGYTRFNATVCSPCPAGSFKSTASNERCQPCPENQTSSSASTDCRCQHGFVRTDGNSCEKCPTGSFARNEECVACPDLDETVIEWHQFAESDKHPNYNQFSCSKVCALQHMTCDESALQSTGKNALEDIVKQRGTTWDLSKPQAAFDGMISWDNVCDPRAPFTHDESYGLVLRTLRSSCTSKSLCEINDGDQGGIISDDASGEIVRYDNFNSNINRICSCKAGVHSQIRTRWIKASKKDSCTAACADIGGACNQEAISAIGVGAIPKLYGIELRSPTDCEYFTPYQSGNYVYLNYADESWCSKTTTCDAETNSDGQNRLCACNVPEYSEEYNEAYDQCFAGL